MTPKSTPELFYEWQPIATMPDGATALTRIDDEQGIRNEQRLKRSGRLFFVPDGSMYVYYTPTHWRADT